MPCFHFTWHAYGSWLPDHAEGSFHWSRGWQPPDKALATCYREKQQETVAHFSATSQHGLISTLVDIAQLLEFRLHFVATETTHIHVLASWPDERPGKRLRRSIRRSLTDWLNRIQRRKWFSRGGGCWQVTSEEHFENLIRIYLPSHTGRKWSEIRRLFE